MTNIGQLTELKYDLLIQTTPENDVHRVKRAAKILAVCQQGLSDFELCKLLDFEDSQTLSFFMDQYFQGVASKFQVQWVMEFNELKHYIRTCVIGEEERVQLHQEISKSYQVTMEKDILLLEERIYHLCKSKDYSGLKQFLSDIEHFLFFYNPFTKRSLFRYWQYLEQAGFEPVLEYSKSMDAFESRAIPSSYDLLKIIMQLSRFFKEFSDFEGQGTPEFQHPSILNKHSLRSDIGSQRREVTQDHFNLKVDAFSRVDSHRTVAK